MTIGVYKNPKVYSDDKKQRDAWETSIGGKWEQNTGRLKWSWLSKVSSSLVDVALRAHSMLTDILGVDVTSTNATKDKHVSNANGEKWETHVDGSNYKHAANVIVNTPAGGIAATNVQSAVNELDTEKANLADPTFSGGVRITLDGGIAILMIAGENLVKGEVVYVDQASGVNNRAKKAPTSNDMPIGVVLADATSGNTVYIVVAGVALVLPNAADTAVRGYLISTSTTTAGRVNQDASLPAVAQHNREIGHWLDSGTGAGVITRAVLHFN